MARRQLKFVHGDTFKMDTIIAAKKDSPPPLPLVAGKAVSFSSVMCKFVSSTSQSMMAAGRTDGGVSVWKEPELRSSRESSIKTSAGHLGAVTSMCYHAERDWLFTGSNDRTIKIWDPFLGPGSAEPCLQTLQGHSSTVTGLVDSSEGAIISCSLDCSLRVWRPKGPKGKFDCVQTLVLGSDARNGLTALAASPGVAGQSAWVLYCGDSLGGVTSFSLAPAGILQAGTTWRKVHSLGVSHLLLVRQHGLVVTLGMEGLAAVVDTARGAVSCRLEHPRLERFTGLVWSSLGECLLLVDAAGGLLVWSLYAKAVVGAHLLCAPLDPNSPGVARHGLVVREAVKGFPAAAAATWLGPRALAVCLPQRGLVQVFRSVEKVPPVEMRGHEGPVVGVLSVAPLSHPGAADEAAEMHEQLVLSAGSDGTVRCFDTFSHRERYRFGEESGRGSRVGDDGREPLCMISVPHLNQVRWFGRKLGGEWLLGAPIAVADCYWRHCSRGGVFVSVTTAWFCFFQVLVGDLGGGVSFYHPDRGLIGRKLEHSNSVTGLAFAFVRTATREEEFLLSCSYDGSVGLWLLDDGGAFRPHVYLRVEAVHGLDKRGQPREVLCVAFHEPSQLVATGGSDGHLRCFCVADRSVRHWSPGCAMLRLLMVCHFSPDAPLRFVCVQARFILRGHSEAVSSVVADSESGLLVSGSEDGAVVLWALGMTRVASRGVEDMPPLASFFAHTDTIRDILFLPHGAGKRHFATASADRLVKVWEYSSKVTESTARAESEEKEAEEWAEAEIYRVCSKDNSPTALGCLGATDGSLSCTSLLIGTRHGPIVKVTLSVL